MNNKPTHFLCPRCDAPLEPEMSAAPHEYSCAECESSWTYDELEKEARAVLQITNNTPQSNFL